MKRLLTTVLILAACTASAVEISVTVSDLTSQQEARLNTVLAEVNAKRVEAGLAPFADYDAYARWVLIQATLGYEAAILEAEAKLAAEAVKEHGDEIAAAGQCTAAGLSAGCRKSQVACFVLTGSPDCNP